MDWVKNQINMFYRYMYYQKNIYNDNKKLKTAPRKKITKEEIRAVKLLYKNFRIHPNINWLEYYKHYLGYIDPYFITPDLWKGRLESSLNSFKYRFIQNKGILHKFIDKEYLPLTIINKMYGIFFDDRDNVISELVAISKLVDYDQFVFKVTVETGGGRGVRLIDNTALSQGERIKMLNNLLRGCDNFLCQEVIEGNEKITKFNKSKKTVNTIRCFSLNLNKKISIISSFMRMGGGDSLCDNITPTSCLSSNGIVNCSVGITENGFLTDFGIDKVNYGEKILKSPSGIIFKGKFLDFYSGIKSIVMELHAKLPMLKFIAWDVTLDKNGKVRIIEVNLDSQNIETHHIFNGAVFKERFCEIMSYVDNNPIFLIK